MIQTEFIKKEKQDNDRLARLTTNSLATHLKKGYVHPSTLRAKHASTSPNRISPNRKTQQDVVKKLVPQKQPVQKKRTQDSACFTEIMDNLKTEQVKDGSTSNT